MGNSIRGSKLRILKIRELPDIIRQDTFRKGKNLKILVTGAAGFIGSNFVYHMLETHPDYDIVGLDALTYAGNLETLAPVMDNPHF